MPSTDQAFASLQESQLHLMKLILQLQSRCEALYAAIADTAAQAGLDAQAIVGRATALENQLHSQRLLQCETKAPDLAAKLAIDHPFGEGPLADEQLRKLFLPKDKGKEQDL